MALAAALIHPADVLILDEPTNHLDSEMVAWLEDWLRRFKGGLVMVTHDRYFLERVVNHITELSRGKLYHYEANYSKYLELRGAAAGDGGGQRAQAPVHPPGGAGVDHAGLQGPHHQVQGAHRSGTRPCWTRTRRRRTKPSQMAAASSRLGKKIIELHDVSKSFDGRPIVSHFSYNLLRNDRIGIVGRNGAGKSTLLHLIAGELAPDSGTVEVGATVKIGHFSQEGRELDLQQRVYDFIHDIADEVKTDEGTFSANQMMERFLFPGDLQSVPIGRLSGGERRRLYLLSVLMEAPNVLLLDEPTNDLDVTTLSILEDYLQGFPGPILAVSHDRFFLDKLAESNLRGPGRRGDRPLHRQLDGLAGQAPGGGGPRPQGGKAQSRNGAAPGAEAEILLQGAAGVRDHRRRPGPAGGGPGRLPGRAGGLRQRLCEAPGAPGPAGGAGGRPGGKDGAVGVSQRAEGADRCPEWVRIFPGRSVLCPA